MVSIDAMRFDTNGFHIHTETADERVWSTSEGHCFGVRIRPGPSTMLTLLRDPDAFPKFRVGVVRTGQALHEFAPIQRDGWVLVRIILKGAMDPTSSIGRLYGGHLIIPFHDASIVVAVSAYEAEGTGVRESEVRAVCSEGFCAMVGAMDRPSVMISLGVDPLRHPVNRMSL